MTRPWRARACAPCLSDCKAPADQVVGEAAHAVQAMEQLQHQTFDVVLLDIHMPGADGLSSARMLQTLPTVRR